jgi:hypothetical protein
MLGLFLLFALALVAVLPQTLTVVLARVAAV